MSVSIALDKIGAFGAPAVYEQPADPRFNRSFVVRIRDSMLGAIQDPSNGGYLVGFSPICTHMGCLLVRGPDDHDVVYDAD
ncbi:MAG: hypothetical protein N2C14_00565, partial [Planctomycetales bacterium]